MDNSYSSRPRSNHRNTGGPGPESGPLWKLIPLLGAFALLRPLLNLTGVAGDDGLLHPGVATIGATILVTVVWVVVVHVARAPHPFLTLVGAGLTYAVLSIALSGVLSTILHGELQGPLATPTAIPSMLLINAAWGALAGGAAAALRQRGSR